MWVIYCKQTGEEIDRVEHLADVRLVIVDFEDTNTFGYTANKRWED